MTNIKTQQQFIGLLKDLITKAAFPADVLGAVHSINSTLEDEQAITILRAVIRAYDRQSALHHIAFLMRDFDITQNDLQAFKNEYQRMYGTLRVND